MRHKKINFETLDCAWTHPAYPYTHAYASTYPRDLILLSKS